MLSEDEKGSPRTLLRERVLAALGWLLLVVFFIASIFILTARWFVTTQLSSHSDEIAAFIAETTGIDITAERMDVGFTVIHPVISLHNVKLSRRGGPVSLSLPSVQAELSWSSLWHLEPRFSTLIISHPTLDIRKVDENHWDVDGFAINTSLSTTSSEAEAGQRFSRWLFGQGRLMIEDGTFRYHDESSSTNGPLTLERVTAVFRQELFDYRTAVSGILMEGSTPRSFDLRARIRKNIFALPDNPLTWSGELYGDLDRIRASELLKNLGLKGPLYSGIGSTRFWASFEQGRVTSITADLALADVRAQLAPKLAELRLPRLTGRLHYADDGSQTRFSAKDFTFTTLNDARFGPSDIEAQCDHDVSGTVIGCSFKASELSLSNIAKIGTSLPLPAAALKLLRDRPFSGTLRQLNASFNGDYADLGAWTFSSFFTGLSLPPANDGMPGVRNISGEISTSNPGEFEVDLDTHYATLYFPGIFRHPQMNFSSITGRVSAALHSTPKFTFTNITAVSADGTVRGSGTWESTGGAGTINISGTAEGVDGAAVHKYLPIVVGDPALDYVEAAVLAGRVSNGRWEVRGKLDDFPWDGAAPQEGHFLIEGDVTDGRMDFMPSRRAVTRSGRTEWAQGEHWPLLTNIVGRMQFEGNRMTITGHSASSGGLKARDVVVEIPSFAADPVMLTVKGAAEGDLKDALAYLSTTPFLKEIYGESFDQSKGSGSVQTILDLALPLTGNNAPKWSVTSTISNGRFQYLPILPEITQLSGTLLTADSGVLTPKPLVGKTSAGPITISATPNKNEAQLKIVGTVSGTDIERLMTGTAVVPIVKHLSGSAPYSVDTRISFADGAVRITGETPAVDILSPLPAPLEKPAGRTANTQFTFFTKGGATNLEVIVDKLVSLDLHWQGDALARGWIGIGLPMRKIDSGIEVGVKATKLDAADWLGIWDEIEDLVSTSQPNSSAKTGAKPSSLAAAALNRLTKIEVDIDDISWKESQLGGLVATLRQVPGIWHLRANGGVAAGQIEYQPKAENGRGFLSVKLNRLNLPELPAAEDKPQNVTDPVPPQAPEPSTLRVSDLPDISLVIDELSWGKRRIGKMELTAAADDPLTWRIQNLTIRNPGATISAQGAWSTTALDPVGRTSASFKANVINAGTLLTSLDVKDAVHDAPGNADFQLSWAGHPGAFNTPTLSGRFHASAGAGQLLQVEPGAGRLLSLMSMQHLLQRLTLDFRDVLSKGFRFDSFRSEGTINNGVLHFTKSTVAGSAATVVIQGDANFVTNLLDIKALVLPSLNGEAASLAVAIANPAIGIGSLIAQWMFKDQISSILSSEYSIAGPIDDPIVKKVESFGTRVERLEDRAKDAVKGTVRKQTHENQ